MTPDEARSCLERGEPDVLYRPPGGEPEHGVLASVTARFAFVRYGTRLPPAATDFADLEALTPDQARHAEFRRSLRSTGDSDG